MCGRYKLAASGDEVAEFFGLRDSPALTPRYNIAPTQTAPVVRHAPEGAGLVRGGAGDPACRAQREADQSRSVEQGAGHHSGSVHGQGRCRARGKALQ